MVTLKGAAEIVVTAGLGAPSEMAQWLARVPEVALLTWWCHGGLPSAVGVQCFGCP